MRSTDLISISALAIASAMGLGCNRNADAPADAGKTAVGDQEAGGAAGGLSEKGRELILAAAADGMLELEAGKLAESRAQTEPVRQFARMMVEHHTRANEELAKLAETKTIALPRALDEDAQDELDELREESGRDFDEEYIDLMIDEHQRVIRELERAAERDEDPTPGPMARPEGGEPRAPAPGAR